MKQTKHLFCPSAVVAILLLATQLSNAEAKTCFPGYFKAGNRCVECPKNTFSSFANVTKCTPCPLGQTSLAGANAIERCKGCKRGTVFDSALNSCKICPKNTYTSVKGAMECTPCPEGTVSSTGGQGIEECQTCQAGSVVYRPRPFWTVVCSACRFGESTSEINSESCSKCPVGFFKQSNKRFSTCQPCRVGRFTNREGTVYCQRCPVGFYQDTVGQTACKKCPEDSTSKLGWKSCRPTCRPGSPGCMAKICDPGFGLNLTTGECEICPPGTVSPEKRTTPCFECPGESVVNPSRTKCTCKPGFTALANGMCQKCPNGFSNTDGGKCRCALRRRVLKNSCRCAPFSIQVGLRCRPCDPKFVRGCLNCPFGLGYDKKSRECNLCPANTYRDDYSRCQQCPKGGTSAAGSGSCRCENGRSCRN